MQKNAEKLTTLALGDYLQYIIVHLILKTYIQAILLYLAIHLFIGGFFLKKGGECWGLYSQKFICNFSHFLIFLELETKFLKIKKSSDLPLLTHNHQNNLQFSFSRQQQRLGVVGHFGREKAAKNCKCIVHVLLRCCFSTHFYKFNFSATKFLFLLYVKLIKNAFVHLRKIQKQANSVMAIKAATTRRVSSV